MPIAVAIIAVISIYVIITDMIGHNTSEQVYPQWIQYEIEMFPELKERQIIYNQRHFDVPISNNDIRIVELFYLAKAEHNSEWPTFICIHGTMGFSTNYIDMMHQMPAESNCYSLDMVGFGKSKCINTKDMEMPRDFLELEIQTISEFMKYIGVEQAHFIGHSFGCYLIAEYANKFPDSIASLTLISPAGLFPTLGVYARYYGMIYQSCFPYSICTKLTAISPKIGKELLTLFVDANKAGHWIATYGNNSCFGGELVSSLIEVNKIGGFCKKYTFTKLLRLSHPIHFIYGETDDITPAHQGKLFCKISPDNTTIKICKGLWHAPLSKYAIFLQEHLARCVAANANPPTARCVAANANPTARCVAANANPPTATAESINKASNILSSHKQTFAAYLESTLNMQSYISSYDVSATKQTIEKLYNHIIYLYDFFETSEREYLQKINFAQD